MNKKKYAVLAGALVIIAVSLYGYVQSRGPQHEGPPQPWVYENRNLGFALDLPADWRDRTHVQEESNKVSLGLASDREARLLFEVSAIPLAEFQELEQRCEGVMDRETRDQWMGSRAMVGEGDEAQLESWAQCSHMDDTYVGKNARFAFSFFPYVSPPLDPLVGDGILANGPGSQEVLALTGGDITGSLVAGVKRTFRVLE